MKDWYKEVREFSAEEISLIQEEPFNEESFKIEFRYRKICK